MDVDLLIHNIAQLITLRGPTGPRRGHVMRELGIVEHGAVAIAGGRIVAVGPESALAASVRPAETLDAGGRAVIPGFVDPHTHLPWAGHRAHEFELRIGGATYMEIMAAGGGIVRTVTDTRAASLDQLVAETGERVRRMLAYGTTTAEAKTGYGLNVADELKQLDAVATVAAAGAARPCSHLPGRTRCTGRIPGPGGRLRRPACGGDVARRMGEVAGTPASLP